MRRAGGTVGFSAVVTEDIRFVEAPSRELMQRLGDLGLASGREIQACRGYVRQLARDLPVFDSVWLDALVRSRVLTPFQARALDSSQNTHLRIGGHVLVDRIHSDGFPELFVARSQGRPEKRMLARCRMTTEEADRRLPRLSEAVERIKTLRTVGLQRPVECGQDGDSLFLVSEAIAGQTLQDLQPLIFGIARLNGRSMYLEISLPNSGRRGSDFLEVRRIISMHCRMEARP